MSKPTELRSAKHQYYIQLRMKELHQKIEDLEASYDDLTRYCIYLEYQQQANNLNIQHSEATFRIADRMRITGTSTMTDPFGEGEARIFEQANNRYHLWKEAERIESGTANKIQRAYRGLDDLECDLAAVRVELVELETVLKELERTDVMDIDRRA
jgi:chaperonin cofactor prefoldin